MLLPDEVAKQWLGEPAEFAILDRLRVLVPAVALFAVCGLVGFAALDAICVLRPLTSLEKLFFSCGTGCGIVSLYTLLFGLAGGLHWRAVFAALPALRCRMGADAVVAIARFAGARTARDERCERR